MEVKRGRFQGVYNIIRFNWHFYVMAGLILLSFLLLIPVVPTSLLFYFKAIIFTSIFVLMVSLLASFYIYDVSDLYKLNWVKDANHKDVLTVNAGFDETSDIILQKFPSCKLTICDFYNPQKHTEISIKRARKVYPLSSKAIQVSTNQLPFPDNSFDYILAILSAHEIRDAKERISFFEELSRTITPTGEIFVTEHLRDFSNFFAYTIGVLHFHSKASWLKTFNHAKLTVKNEIKTTPFITTFILTKDGNTL
jgi:ubiquinone/menaquinone biosynthesis C-methylase UbiE